MITLYDASNIDELPAPDNFDARRAVELFVPLIKNGTRRYIRNVDLRPMIVKMDGLLLPLGVLEPGSGNSYVASLCNHYVEYASAELREIGNPVLKTALHGLIALLGAVLRLTRSDRVVFVDNWLFSTNLHPPLTAGQLSRLAAFLAGRFPRHALVCRSLNTVHHAELLSGLKRPGWLAIGSRQVYLFARGIRPSLKKSQQRTLLRDARLLQQPDYLLSHTIRPGEFDRVTALYHQLYLDKYSRHNPQYTAEFMRLAYERGVLEFRLLRRAQDGRIDAMFGYFRRDEIMTTPIFGYDLSLPRKTGLYRRLSALLLQEAETHHLHLNNSSGASVFKANRGCGAAIEYSAVYCGHLPWSRRLGYRILSAVISGVAIPVIRRLGL